MKIDLVETARYSIPLGAPVGDATHGIISHFTLVTTVVREQAGLAGVGYTYTVGRVGGSAIAAMINDDLAPAVIGEDPRRVEALWKSMWDRTHYVGRGGPASFAISAVDIALWDLKSKALGEPLWRLLGGYNPYVQAYASGIDLNLSLDALETQTESSVERGFRAIKMKVGQADLREDLARVRAVRGLLGPENPLMVDANMKWGVDEAIRASRALAEYDVYWLEEPTAPHDVPGHARIQREGAVPVAAGENLHTVGEFEALISAGGVAFPEPDVTNCGGITAWLKIARLAEARNLPVTTHGVHDLHVSLLAAIPNASFLEVHGFGLDPYLTEPVQITAGCATAPDRPGHGVEFRWSALEPNIEG